MIDDVANQNVSGDFHRGEKTENHVEVASPTEMVGQFIKHRSAGVKGIVESTIAYAAGISSFKDDADKHEQFLQKLHEAKVLSVEEMQEGLAPKSGAMVSKMKKISEYAAVILDPRILPFVTPGYSNAYALVQLYEDLEMRQEGIDRLRDVLLSCNGPITRKWLSEQRKKLRIDVAKASATEVDAPSIVPDIEPTSAAALHEGEVEAVQQVGGNFGAVETETPKPPVVALLMTGNSRDAARLSKAHEGTECLKLRSEIADKAVLIVRAKAGTLLSMSATIKSLGFDRCSRVGLITDPTDHDITSSDMMAIYIRGGVKLATEITNWRSEKDVIKLADHILEGIDGRRVHLFAKSDADGWESLIGDENWQV